MSATISYRLAVLTHGQGETLPATLRSFREMATPAPTDAMIHSDGTTARTPVVEEASLLGCPVTLTDSFAQRGFCRSTRDLWRQASYGDHDYVFWLEHDFLLLRPVDLVDLAVPLAADPTLAQMALMRGPVNTDERAAGGLYELRRDLYEPRLEGRAPERPHDPAGPLHAWLQHGLYFTTNPSLMRRSFMAARRWPDYGSECEGRFGIDLRAAGYRFGAWGAGEPWVEHIGRRDGRGY